jgi:hypothetical protein
VVFAVFVAFCCPPISLTGIYSHSGDSYNCPGESIQDVKAGADAIGRGEVATMAGTVWVGKTVVTLQTAASSVVFRADVRKVLESHGIAVPVVSVGATPSVTSCTDFTGITEVCG